MMYQVQMRELRSLESSVKDVLCQFRATFFVTAIWGLIVQINRHLLNFFLLMGV